MATKTGHVRNAHTATPIKSTERDYRSSSFRPFTPHPHSMSTKTLSTAEPHITVSIYHGPIKRLAQLEKASCAL
jgi:hypothetical protein